MEKVFHEKKFRRKNVTRIFFPSGTNIFRNIDSGSTSHQYRSYGIHLLYLFWDLALLVSLIWYGELQHGNKREGYQGRIQDFNLGGGALKFFFVGYFV